VRCLPRLERRSDRLAVVFAVLLLVLPDCVVQRHQRVIAPEKPSRAKVPASPREQQPVREVGPRTLVAHGFTEVLLSGVSLPPRIALRRQGAILLIVVLYGPEDDAANVAAPAVDRLPPLLDVP